MKFSRGFAFSVFALFAFSCKAQTNVPELAICDIHPSSIIFQNEGSILFSSSLLTRRYIQENGKFFPPTTKNPENSAENGPMVARNCSPNSDINKTQRIRFRLRAVNFFDNGFGSHIAIASRANFNRTLNQPGGSQEGRGLAIFHHLLIIPSFDT
jgi:hypothetical protein